MKDLNQLKHLRFTIIGGARSGLSCIKLLRYFNLNVSLSDNNQLSEKTIQYLNEHNIPFEHNGHSFSKIIENTDILIISPGIPLSSELTIQANKKNIPILSEIEIASWFFTENIISFGITGTNGKSTTTNYLAHLLKQVGYSFACGNIGTPLSEIVYHVHEKKLFDSPVYLSIELSSYQLESIHYFQPRYSCFLNLQNDHMARYESMDEYLKAKWRLILLTQNNGLAVIEKNVLNHAIKIGLPLPKCSIVILDSIESELIIENQLLENKSIEYPNNEVTLCNNELLPIALYKELKNQKIEKLIPKSNFYTAKIHYLVAKNSAQILFSYGKNEIPTILWDIKNSILNGVHNIINMISASILVQAENIPIQLIIKEWEKLSSNYVQLSHRLEVIDKENSLFKNDSGITKKLTIINDSKATNVESTLVAVKAFNSFIRLLIGGEPKGDSYLPIMETKDHRKIKIYPFGKAGPKIFEELKNSSACANTSPTLLQAAELAFLEANENDIILLSPACSSFDEFKDFEHRGQIFCNWAHKMRIMKDENQ
jgi:UDP-N-acetylmuramoylalanine--D-glutamate ligase